MHRSTTFLLLSLLSAISFTHAQVAVADGAIVPFTSGLPACASLCGPLFDVQGKCSPPNIAAVDDNCFCTDNRLTAFNNAGTTGVTAVCGSASCTAAADLEAVKTWYDNFCSTKSAVTTTGTGSAATGTSTSTTTPKSAANTGGQSWIAGHYKWVIMLVVLVFLIVGGWIAACLLRRRYLRKREKEIEMLPPIATGPHQLQAMTGGYSGHTKEASTMVTTGDAVNQKRESRGWLKKART